MHFSPISKHASDGSDPEFHTVHVHDPGIYIPYVRRGEVHLASQLVIEPRRYHPPHASEYDGRVDEYERAGPAWIVHPQEVHAPMYIRQHPGLEPSQVEHDGAATTSSTEEFD